VRELRDVHLTITDNRLPRAKAKTLEALGAKLRIAEVVDKAHLNRESAGALDVSTAIETNLIREQANAHREKRETLIHLGQAILKPVPRTKGQFQ